MVHMRNGREVYPSSMALESFKVTMGTEIGVDEYSSSKTYAVGDYCIYTNTIYKCKTAITTPEAFNSSKWDATSIADEIKSTKQSLSDLIPVEKTASGAIVTFDEGSGLPFKSLVVSIEPYQEGSGDPSPTNIRSISGWDKCKVSVCGTNVWDEDWELGSINTGTGANVESSAIIRSKNYILVNSNTAYYHLNRLQLFFYDKDKNYISYLAFTNAGVFTTPNNAVYMRFTLTSNYGTTYNNDISINYPSTDTEYHAYNGHTYIIDLDGTRYGGTLDVVSGLLTVDRAYVDLGTLYWSYASAQKVFYDNLPTNALNVTNKNGLCEGYIPTAQQSMDAGTWSRISDGEFVFAQNLKTNGRCAVVIKNLNYTDATEFKSSVNGMKMLYPLSTPQSIQLTPTQVKSLLGVNNIWTDTGDLELTYFVNNSLVYAIYDMINILTS